jgi:hypothetical protein
MSSDVFAPSADEVSRATYVPKNSRLLLSQLNVVCNRQDLTRPEVFHRARLREGSS